MSGISHPTDFVIEPFFYSPESVKFSLKKNQPAENRLDSQ